MALSVGDFRLIWPGLLLHNTDVIMGSDSNTASTQGKIGRGELVTREAAVEKAGVSAFRIDNTQEIVVAGTKIVEIAGQDSITQGNLTRLAVSGTYGKYVANSFVELGTVAFFFAGSSSGTRDIHSEVGLPEYPTTSSGSVNLATEKLQKLKDTKYSDSFAVSVDYAVGNTIDVASDCSSAKGSSTTFPNVLAQAPLFSSGGPTAVGIDLGLGANFAYVEKSAWSGVSLSRYDAVWAGTEFGDDSGTLKIGNVQEEFDQGWMIQFKIDL